MLKGQWLTLCNQVLSAIVRIEKIFSTFLLVHLKLRNRLENEEAGKLTFAYKYLNSNTNRKKTKILIGFTTKNLFLFKKQKQKNHNDK